MVVAPKGGWDPRLLRLDQRSETFAVAVDCAGCAFGGARVGIRLHLPPEEAARHLHRRPLRVDLSETSTLEREIKERPDF